MVIFRVVIYKQWKFRNFRFSKAMKIPWEIMSPCWDPEYKNVVSNMLDCRPKVCNGKIMLKLKMGHTMQVVGCIKEEPPYTTTDAVLSEEN